MRIGIDARVLYVLNMKGMGVYLYNLLFNLVKIDLVNEYYLYYDSRQEIVKRLPDTKNIYEKGISVKKGDRFFFWEQVRLPQQLIEDRIDILHSPANTTIGFTKVPRIATVHDTILQTASHKNLWDNIYFKKIQPIILRKIDKIITDSNFSKEKIIEVMGISSPKIEVIPINIDNKFIVIKDRDKIEKTKKKYNIYNEYILNVGGESPWKNVSQIIKTYAYLVKTYRIKQNLVITGIREKEILERHFQEIADLGISNKVIVLRYVNGDDLVILYNGAKLFLYPSLMEGFGLPPLEAMACGVPVVASKSASIPEVVGNAALLINATNTEEIAKAVMSLIQDDGLRNQIIEAGFKRCKIFSWEQTARRTLEIYKQVFFENTAKINKG